MQPRAPLRPASTEERRNRTRWVVSIDRRMMVVEIAAGILFGSMALLADRTAHGVTHGRRSTSRSSPTSLPAVAPRRPASALAPGSSTRWPDLTSAIVLALFALLMVVESIDRFVNPFHCVQRSHRCRLSRVGGQRHQRPHPARPSRRRRITSPRSTTCSPPTCYVMADALTSLLAITALLAAKYLRPPVDGPGDGHSRRVIGRQMVVGPFAGDEQGAG